MNSRYVLTTVDIAAGFIAVVLLVGVFAVVDQFNNVTRSMNKPKCYFLVQDLEWIKRKWGVMAYFCKTIWILQALKMLFPGLGDAKLNLF